MCPIHLLTHLYVMYTVCQTICTPSLSVHQMIHHYLIICTTNHVAHLYVDTSVCHVHSLSDHLSMSDHLYTIFASPSDDPSPPDHLYNKSTSLPDCLSTSNYLSETSTCLSDVQSLAVMNGINPPRTRNSVGPLRAATYFYMI